MDVGALAIGLVALVVVLGLRRFQLRGAGALEVGETRFAPIADIAALRSVLAATGPGLLFLHDPGCPISAGAHREMARLGGVIPMVNVRRSHDVSQAVETETGVPHESPQVLVLAGGRVIWSASHHAITAAAVRRTIAAAGRGTADEDATSDAG